MTRESRQSTEKETAPLKEEMKIYIKSLVGVSRIDEVGIYIDASRALLSTQTVSIRLAGDEMPIEKGSVEQELKQGTRFLLDFAYFGQGRPEERHESSCSSCVVHREVPG